jgi:hypothetical protein
MKIVTAGIGLLVLIFLASIFMPMYMSNALSANTSAWSPIMIQLQNNYIPLIAMVAILVLIIMAAFVNKKW